MRIYRRGKIRCSANFGLKLSGQIQYTDTTLERMYHSIVEEENRHLALSSFQTKGQRIGAELLLAVLWFFIAFFTRSRKG